MLTHEEVSTPAGSRAVLVDSISFVRDGDAEAVVVCASHGGASSGEYAAKYSLGLVIFNDAGVGKDRAGISALDFLHTLGRAACAVSNDSSRIGDVADQWENGVISHVNETASSWITPGMTVHEAIDSWNVRVAA